MIFSPEYRLIDVLIVCIQTGKERKFAVAKWTEHAMYCIALWSM